MYKILVDVGNSNIVIGLYSDDGEKKVYRFTTDLSKTFDEYYLSFKPIFKTTNIESIIISSVVPKVTTTLTHLFYEKLNIKPQIIAPGFKTGVRVNTDNSKEVGSDLICDVRGAMKYSNKGLVIDLGTASKIIWYDNKELKGVVIAPGIKISSEILTNSASLLSDFALEKPKKVLGTNTIECMQSGIVFGHIAMINGLIKMIFEELGEEVPIYLTGGLSVIIKDDLEFKVTYKPNLILDALYDMSLGDNDEIKKS